MPKQVFRLTPLEVGEILGRHLIKQFSVGGEGKHSYRTVTSFLPNEEVEVTIEVVERNVP